ncbi:MAG TPA: PAS domain-containing protein, partial [Thermoanaerobaculia bacterium]
MARKSFAFNLLLALVTVVAVAGAFTAFQRKRSSFERLDFQYHWQKGIIIVDGVDADSGAARAGIKRGDQIWIVGGSPSSDIDGLKRTLRRMGPVPLVIARGNDTLTLNYSAPPLKIDYSYLFLTFIGFLYLAIGLFTLFRGTRDQSRLFYFVTLLAFIVYVYTPAGKTDLTLKSIWIVEEFARIFLPPLTLHFFLRFPRKLMPGRWTLPAIYAAPAALLILDLVAFNVQHLDQRRLFAFIDRWQMLDFAVYFTLAFVALTYTYRTAPVVGQKKQIKWIYLGMGVGFIPFLVLYLIPFILKGAGSAYTTMAILPLALIPLAFAVSILKYKLWDVEVVIKEVLAYTVMFIFGMIAFSTVNLLLSHLLEERLALERNFLAFASGLLIAGVLVPMKSRLESWFDMFLYRETYRHRKAMLDFAQELATFHDLHELIDLMRDRLSAALTLQKLNLYVREGNRYTVYQSEPDIPQEVRRDDFPDLPTDRPLMLDIPRLPESSESAMTLLRAGYRYLFPLRYRGQLEGMLLCGTRRADEALSRDDLQLIGSLTVPLSLAIENARLYGRLRRQIEEIRSLKEYNENIIESSSSAIVVVTHDGTILTANRAFWDLVGVEAGDERSIHSLFPPYAATTRDFAATEHQFVNQRGEEKEITVSASAFHAPDAPVGATVLVIGDISDRVRL